MNLQKIELFPINTPAVEYAQTFQCKVGQFPLQYLGFFLKDKKLTVADWQSLINKLENRLQSWKWQLLSLGGRLTLINSVLSAYPCIPYLYIEPLRQSEED